MAKTTAQKIAELVQYPVYADQVLDESDVRQLASLTDAELALVVKLVARRARLTAKLTAEQLHSLPPSGVAKWIDSHRGLAAWETQ